MRAEGEDERHSNNCMYTNNSKVQGVCVCVMLDDKPAPTYHCCLSGSEVELVCASPPSCQHHDASCSSVVVAANKRARHKQQNQKTTHKKNMLIAMHQRAEETWLPRVLLPRECSTCSTGHRSALPSELGRTYLSKRGKQFGEDC